MITTHQHYLIDFGSELISSLILSNYFEYKLQTEEVEIQTFNSEKKSSVSFYSKRIYEDNFDGFISFYWASGKHPFLAIFYSLITVFSLALVLGTDHTTGLFIALWVVSNQVIVAILSHQWYKQNFPNYTKKAIIPFVLWCPDALTVTNSKIQPGTTKR